MYIYTYIHIYIKLYLSSLFDIMYSIVWNVRDIVVVGLFTRFIELLFYT